MNRPELVHEILDYIRKVYKAEYVGYIEVTEENSIYVLCIGIPNYMMPTTISGEFENDQDFLNYVYEELRKSNYMRVYFYEVTRTFL